MDYVTLVFGSRKSTSPSNTIIRPLDTKVFHALERRHRYESLQVGSLLLITYSYALLVAVLSPNRPLLPSLNPYCFHLYSINISIASNKF
jgi:hypothetical protein